MRPARTAPFETCSPGSIRPDCVSRASSSRHGSSSPTISYGAPTLHLPQRGEIAIFNRSYYEEVLVVRVHPELLRAQRLPETSMPELWAHRYHSIVEHERHLAEQRTVILKFWLNISQDEQRKRLLARIDEPDKRWKFRAADLDERARWDDYQAAYGECFGRDVAALGAVVCDPGRQPSLRTATHRRSRQCRDRGARCRVPATAGRRARPPPEGPPQARGRLRSHRTANSVTPPRRADRKIEYWRGLPGTSPMGTISLESLGYAIDTDFRRTLLQGIALFRGIDADCVGDLLPRCGRMDVTEGEVLLSPDRENHCVYVVLSGRLARASRLARRAENRRLGPGSCAGEMSLIEDKDPSAFVVATENSHLMVISHTSAVAAWSIARTRSARTCSSCSPSASAPTTSTSRAASACCARPSATHTPTP